MADSGATVPRLKGRITRGASAAADVLQRGAVDRAQAGEHVVAELTAALYKIFLTEDIEGFETNGCGERIAAEGRSVRAGRKDVHQMATTNESGHRKDAAAIMANTRLGGQPSTLRAGAEALAGRS